MTADEALGQYRDMLIMDTHPTPDGGVIIELGLAGRVGVRRWVTVRAIGAADHDAEPYAAHIAVSETVDPPAPRPRNRRGYTDAPTIDQHHIDQGDDRAEREREQTDWCDL